MAGAIETQAQVGERILGCAFPTALGCDDEQPTLRRIAQQILDPVERVAVTPLDIVQHQQEGGRTLLDGMDHRLEEPSPLGRLGHRRGGTN